MEYSTGRNPGAPRRFQIRLEEGVTTLGMVPAALPPMQVIVGQVEPGSWAHRNGVSAGDELVAVDGMPVVEISVITLDKLLRQVRPLLLTFESLRLKGRKNNEVHSPMSSRSSARSSRCTGRSRDLTRLGSGALESMEQDSRAWRTASSDDATRTPAGGGGTSCDESSVVEREQPEDVDDGLPFESLPGKDLALSIVFRLPASDIRACKAVALKQGYGAFVVHRGTAYFRRESPGRCRASITDSPQCTTYVSNPQEGSDNLEVDVGGRWVPLEPEVRKMLADVTAQGRRSFQYECRGSRYEIDLEEMVQTSALAGIKRKLRRAPAATDEQGDTFDRESTELSGSLRLRGVGPAEPSLPTARGVSPFSARRKAAASAAFSEAPSDRGEQLLRDVCGLWVYDAFQYEVTRIEGQRVLFQQVCTDHRDPSKLHKVSGVLKVQGQWLEGDILYGDSVRLGAIRLWKQPEVETLVSCVKLVDQDQWGRETYAHRVKNGERAANTLQRAATERRYLGLRSTSRGLSRMQRTGSAAAVHDETSQSAISS
mmetsp:Transcript_113826/g.226538  ORF Transcript_113826/g.226538 Transcript_113826/m.226538 type:complete len:542 (+) Transcript_113826:88-1713(+)